MSAPPRNRIDTKDLGSFKISSAEREVRRAIKELRDSDKSAYMEALDKAPDLVAAESRVDRFLRREKSNVNAAAKLQARYWKDRKAFFGDRAFLPLDDLTGNGALTNDDVEALSRGIMVRTPDDDAGRPSLLIDVSRGGDTSVASLVRIHCLFYWLSLQIAQNPKAQTEGFNMIRVINGSPFDRNIVTKLIKVIQTSLPVKIYSSHIVVIAPAERRQQYLETIMPMLVELTSEIKAVKNKIHTAQDRNEIIRVLEADGVPVTSVPMDLGGTWDYESFNTWFDLQRKGTNLEIVCASNVAQAEDEDEKMPAIDDSLVEASRVARAEERKERKRQLDVIYARKRRERQKEDTDVLQEQCYRLNQENVNLKEQGEKLERFLGEAQRMVEVLEATSVPPAVVSQPSLQNPSQGGQSQASNPGLSELERQLLQQLLGGNANSTSNGAGQSGIQNQAVTGSPTSEVLLQLLTLSSRNSNTASPSNVISALQQVTPALSLFQTNCQSQEVLVHLLCQVVAMLEQQNQPQVPSNNLATKLIELLPSIQQIQQPTQQVHQQTQQVQSTQQFQMPTQQFQQLSPQSQQFQQPQQHLSSQAPQQFQQHLQQQPQPPAPPQASQHCQPQQALQQPVQVDQNSIQEQLLRLLRNAGLR